MPTDGLKIGIALGSGGAKGLAHIGILKVLEKHGITPDLVTGASMGAIIGAGYCLGMPIKEIEKKAHELLAENSIFMPSNFHYFHESLIRLEDMRKVFYEFVGDSTFEDCKIPFITIGLDLEEGKEVRMEKGRLLESVEASSAIPGIFPPVFIDGKYMVDGALLNPTPVDCLREKNMDIVIGIRTENLTSRQYISAMVWDKFYKKPGEMKTTKHGMLEQAKINLNLMVHILMRTIEVARDLNEKIAILTGHPDIMIEPYTMDMGMLQFERINEAIKAGEEAAEKQMPKLMELIKAKKKDLKR